MNHKTLLHKLSVFVLPRLGEILFAAIFAGAIGLGPQMLNVDGDLGRHITLGNYILENQSIPTRDIFSFTRYGAPLTPHEWLADVIFALAHKAAGLDGVVWLTSVVLAGAFWLVYRHSLALSNMSLVALLGGILAAVAGSFHWLTRPHIFTILLAALWTAELDRLRLGLRKSWIIFPAIMLIWVNLHGAFIAGFVIWGAFLVGTVLDRRQSLHDFSGLAAIGPTAFLVTLLNPDGLGIWRTALGFLGNKYLVSHTAEYLPPDFQNPIFWPFMLMIGLSLLIFGISRVRVNFSYLLLVGGWTAMALYSARNIPLYLVIVIPILCSQVGNALSSDQGTKWGRWLINYQRKIGAAEEQVKGGVLAGALVIISLALLVGGIEIDFQQAGNQFSEEVFPAKAVDWMTEHPPAGNGFNYFPWGGYLLYRRWPEQLVFIDGQTDFYGEELTRKYERVLTVSPGWSDILDEYQIEWILMPVDSTLSWHLDRAPLWDRVYQDNTANIYVQDAP